MKYLIDHGANVNAEDEDGHTPLHHAAIEGYTDAIRYLIRNGGNEFAPDEDSRTPIDYAEAYGNSTHY